MDIAKNITSQPLSPLVSVVIPAYNAAQFIIEAIESVLTQTYENQEIIVIDDGSNDSTFTLVSKTFGEKVTIIEQMNEGPSSARNRGIEESKGRYIAFLDADDIWFPNKIRDQVELMEKFSDVGMVFGNSITLKGGEVSEKSHFEQECLNEDYFGDPVYFKEAFKKLLNKNIIMTQTVMLKRSIIDQTGGFDTNFRFAEDFLLWLNVAKIGKIAYLPQVIAYRRRHDGNLTNDPAKPISNRPRLYKKLLENHGELLSEYGIDIHAKLAHSLYQLGRYRLNEEGKSKVSQYFYESLKIKLTFRCAIYFLLTKLGFCPLLTILRKRMRYQSQKNQI